MLEKERILTEQETSALADTPAADVLTLERKVAPSLWEDISERGANKKVYTKNGRKNGRKIGSSAADDMVSANVL